MEGFKSRQRLLCMSKLRDAAAGFVATHGHQELQDKFLEKAVEEATSLCNMQGVDYLQLKVTASCVKTVAQFQDFARAYEESGQRMLFMRFCQVLANRARDTGDMKLIEELAKEPVLWAFEWKHLGQEMLMLAKGELLWSTI